MSRRRVEVAVLLLLGLLVALVGFRLLTDPLRDVEAAMVLTLLSPVADRVSVVGDHNFQVLPDTHEAFRAHLTPYCSSLIALLALVAIALFVLHAPWPRRLVALATAAALVLVCNVVRITVALYAGYYSGGGALVLFHDWVGTAFAMAYTMAGFFLMLYLLLPSATASIRRAARVSDVL